MICMRCGSRMNGNHHPLCQSSVHDEVIRAELQPMRRKSPKREEFGNCPKCWGNSGFLNNKKEHWCVCLDCRYKWLAGRELNQTWMEETSDIWDRNRQYLQGFVEVRPVFLWDKSRIDWDSRNKKNLGLPNETLFTDELFEEMDEPEF